MEPTGGPQVSNYETGDASHGHDLSKLFDQLSIGSKNTIETKWNTEQAKKSATLDEVDRRAGAAVTARTLKDALTREGKAFENWRYAHEPGPICNFSMANLPGIIRSHILTIKPELR